jgi:hypothetical protein
MITKNKDRRSVPLGALNLNQYKTTKRPDILSGFFCFVRVNFGHILTRIAQVFAHSYFTIIRIPTSFEDELKYINNYGDTYLSVFIL